MKHTSKPEHLLTTYCCKDQDVLRTPERHARPAGFWTKRVFSDSLVGRGNFNCSNDETVGR